MSKKLSHRDLTDWRRHLFSACITFIAGAFIAILPELDELSLASLENGALVGLAFAGIRAGFKTIIEAFLVWSAAYKES